jgi:GDSL/SGNH-like Acyl-Esterase family found in Pmr5 and Cas1p
VSDRLRVLSDGTDMTPGSPEGADRLVPSFEAANDNINDDYDVGALGTLPHQRRRVLTDVRLVIALLCFAVGLYCAGVFDQRYYYKSMGTSFPNAVTTRSSSSSNSNSSRRTNRTNTTLQLYDSKQQQEAAQHSKPPTSLPSSNSNSSSADRDGSDGTSPWHAPNLCRRDQIADGRWVPEHLAKPPYLPPSNNTRCGPAAMYTSTEGWDTYQWVPNDSVSNSSSNSSSSSSSSSNTRSNNGTACTFTGWDKDMFCDLVRHATVTIIGDSLSWEHCMSLVSLLGVRPHHEYQDVSLHRNVNVGHAACPGGLARIVYRRDDDLSKVRSAVFFEDGSNVLPQVVVLNRGAHYANDTDFLDGIRSALDVVEEWLGRCDHLKIKCHFFWRTTVPGHHHCHTFNAPVNDADAMEAYVANLSQYDDTTRGYHWQDFRHQNLLAEAELKKRGPRLPHRILDGYRINLLRPDRHSLKDCLHSCYPGKMDVYPQLLLHYLRGDRTTGDVQRLQTVAFENQWNLNATTVYGLEKRPPA